MYVYIYIYIYIYIYLRATPPAAGPPLTDSTKELPDISQEL